jgi:hypothetical protein
MIPHPSPAVLARAVAVVGLLSCTLPWTCAQSAAESKVTVGIFSRTTVVQVFYRSAIWKAKMQAKLDEQNKAVTGGDAAKADQIDRELTAMQALAQKQLTGDAPLKNILDELKEDWPAIAKEAGVDLIIEAPLYQATGARVIDVTPSIVKRLMARKSP